MDLARHQGKVELLSELLREDTLKKIVNQIEAKAKPSQFETP